MSIEKTVDSQPTLKDGDEIEEFFDLLSTKLSSSNQDELYFVQHQRLAVLSKAAANGNLGSGRTYLAVTEIFANQIRIHRRALCDLINEVYRGFSFDLDDHVKDGVLGFALSQFDAQKDALTSEMLSSVPFKQTGFVSGDHLKKIIDMQAASLESAYAQEKEQLAADVKLLLRMLKKEKEAMKSGHTVNVTGNVTNLQVGERNIIINEASKTAIVNSFNEIRDALQTADLIDEEKRQEIASLMDECEAELNEPTPNKTKIGACLGAVGSAIKGIATLGGAYSAIKMFSQAFGGPALP